MGVIGQTEDSRFAERSPSGASRFPENAIIEKRAYYIAVGGETEITAGDLIGDRISWRAGDFASITVIRSNAGAPDDFAPQIPFIPGMGGTGWGVDLTQPPKIIFNGGALGAGEVVYVLAPNRFQSLVRPEFPNFHTDFFEVAAASTQSTFTLSRPGKLTFYQGQNRGRSVVVEADGNPQRPNTPGTTDGDYTENQIAGTDTFGSITFNTAVGDVLRAINVTIDHKGFYDADNISLQQLIRLQSDFNGFESAQQTITAAGSLTIPHGLSARPTRVLLWLVNTTAEHNYSIGDYLLIGPVDYDGTNSRGVSVVPDATNINLRFGSAASTFNVLNKTTGANAAITNANWRLIVRAWV